MPGDDIIEQERQKDFQRILSHVSRDSFIQFGSNTYYLRCAVETPQLMSA